MKSAALTTVLSSFIMRISKLVRQDNHDAGDNSGGGGGYYGGGGISTSSAAQEARNKADAIAKYDDDNSS